MAKQVTSIEQLSAAFRLRLLRKERKAASEMVRAYHSAWLRVRKKLDLLEKERQRLLKSGEPIPESWFYYNTHYQNLLKQIGDELGKYAAFAEDSVAKQQAEAIRIGLQDAEALALLSLGEIPAGINISWLKLNTRAVETMVGMNQPGSPLHTLFSSFGDEGLRLAQVALQDALILGQGARSVARALRDALGVSLTRALTIARTEVLRAYRTATIASYKENRHIVKGWRWMATLDGRTCASCYAMHGQVFYFDGDPESKEFATHQNCRCTLVSETLSWKEIGERYGIDLSELDEREVETMESLLAKGYSEDQAKQYLMRNLTGEQAFALLDEKTQQDILGKAKFLAWKDGKFEFADLSAKTYDPIWGAGRKTASLTELLGWEEAKRYLDIMRGK